MQYDYWTLHLCGVNRIPKAIISISTAINSIWFYSVISLEALLRGWNSPCATLLEKELCFALCGWYSKFFSTDLLLFKKSFLAFYQSPKYVVLCYWIQFPIQFSRNQLHMKISFLSFLFEILFTSELVGTCDCCWLRYVDFSIHFTQLTNLRCSL